MANDIKLERTQSTILRELNIIIQREFPDAEYLKTISINEVRLTKDMGHAKVFYSSMDSSAAKEDLAAEIADYAKEIRMILAGKMEMRSIPQLEFEFDSSLENANKIDEILKGIK